MGQAALLVDAPFDTPFCNLSGGARFVVNAQALTVRTVDVDAKLLDLWAWHGQRG